MSEQPRRRRRQQVDGEAFINTVNTESSIPYGRTTASLSSKEEIIKYLKDAIEQEAAIVEQQELIRSFQHEAEEHKPVLTVEKPIAKPSITKESVSIGYQVSLAIAILAILVGTWFVTKYTDMKAEAQVAYDVAANHVPKNFYDDRIYEMNCALEDIETANSCITGGIITLVIGFAFLARSLYSFVAIFSANKKIQSTYDKEMKQYYFATKKIESKNASHQVEYDTNLKEWNASTSSIVNTMENTLAVSQSILQRFYQMDRIYPKYRTLPALTSIYEYLITGRCEELTGPHGAYNLYEDELRKDTVISQLNTVIENLEQIKQNQYMLYEQVCAIQQNTAAIRSELAQIKGYTIQIAELAKLNAYYAARTEANTRITMYYHL